MLKQTQALTDAINGVLNESALTNGVLNQRAFKSGVTRIAKLTDNNFHGEAIHAGAKLLDHAGIASKMHDLLKERDDAEKHGTAYPQNMHSRRTALYDQLMDHSKKTLSPEDHHKFYMAY